MRAVLTDAAAMARISSPCFIKSEMFSTKQCAIKTPRRANQNFKRTIMIASDITRRDALKMMGGLTMGAVLPEFSSPEFQAAQAQHHSHPVRSVSRRRLPPGRISAGHHAVPGFIGAHRRMVQPGLRCFAFVRAQPERFVDGPLAHGHGHQMQRESRCSSKFHNRAGRRDQIQGI